MSPQSPLNRRRPLSFVPVAAVDVSWAPSWEVPPAATGPQLGSEARLGVPPPKAWGAKGGKEPLGIGIDSLSTAPYCRSQSASPTATPMGLAGVGGVGSSSTAAYHRSHSRSPSASPSPARELWGPLPAPQAQVGEYPQWLIQSQFQPQLPSHLQLQGLGEAPFPLACPSLLPQRHDPPEQAALPLAIPDSPLPAADPPAAGPDPSEGRLLRDFCGIGRVGKGQFSTVFHVRHKIDKHVYAVKVQAQSDSASREVFALASIALQTPICDNLLRYFTSWLEDGQLYIQTELCECSLRHQLAERRQSCVDPRFGEEELVQVVRQVANGLASLHGLGFVHLDIKPDNILVSREGLYKIADMGHAVFEAGSACKSVATGDCRYLAKEVFQGSFCDLPKADVFSLGMVCYELATNPRALPRKGNDWRRLREGVLETSLMRELSEHLLSLLHRMVHEAYRERPRSDEIAHHVCRSRADKFRFPHKTFRGHAEPELRIMHAQRASDTEFFDFSKLFAPGLGVVWQWAATADIFAYMQIA